MAYEAKQNLRAAIEQLYAVFEPYPLRENMDRCGDCVSAFDNARFRGVPLRDLSVDQLARYAFKAMTTWGDVDDFRHFLPRIFEHLAADGGGGWIDPEVVFGKLPYGGFQNWPAREQAAIETYCVELWSVVKGDPSHPFEIESCLCCIARVCDDLNLYLAMWTPAQSIGEAIRFAELLENQRPAKPGRRFKLANSFWGNCVAPAQQVVDWLLLPDRVVDLESAFFAFSADADAAGTLSKAFNKLCRLRWFALNSGV